MIHAHHLDYTDPAAIAWLCPNCHRAAHPRPSAMDWQRLWDNAAS